MAHLVDGSAKQRHGNGHTRRASDLVAPGTPWARLRQQHHAVMAAAEKRSEWQVSPSAMLD